uniref:Ribonuclease A-domain domain-containing protein n=1 Tax=Seriola lalandi dorsalis TaxID=1841481 RepID=A0A3B4YB48_SERLL
MNVRCQFSCLMLVLLSVAQCTEGGSFQSFKRQHINDNKTDMDESECATVMMERKIKCNNKYKKINTFILCPAEEVRVVCHSPNLIEKRIYLNKTSSTYDSEEEFNIVVCKQQQTKPKLLYNGTKEIARIRISCRDGLPVHFEKHLLGGAVEPPLP